jgi:hypothetical protein
MHGPILKNAFLIAVEDIVAQVFFIGTIASKSSRELATDAKKTLYHL